MVRVHVRACTDRPVASMRAWRYPRPVVRFFANLAAPATHIATAWDAGAVVGAFAFLLGDDGTLHTAGTYVVRAYRQRGVAQALWLSVRRRVGRRVRWSVTTISRRGTALVAWATRRGFRVDERRQWPQPTEGVDQAAFR